MRAQYKILLSFVFAVLYSLGFTHPLNPPAGGWYQQFMPNIGNRQISDIFFLDSLTGWAVTPYLSVNDTSYVLKTTNRGDNWFIQHSRIGQFVGSNRIIILNAYTGYTAGVSNLPAYSAILKTTNGGNNWFNINPPTDPFTAKDISILNEDTIWVVSDNSLTGGVFRTTNGGLNWEQQFSAGSQNPNKIYMFNARIGFISGNSIIYRTTNSGENWNVNLNNENFTDMHFVDSLIGWKCTNSSSQAGTIKKTTNGGLNWTIQNLPPESPPFTFSRMFKFSFVNKDTIWGIGGVYTFSGGQSRGVIYKTTNGGLSWGYQIPDTGINIYIYNTIQFVSKRIGWAYSPLLGGVHTTTGGDTIMGVHQIGSEIPDDYRLYQNYPNPFNPRTVIKYQLQVTSHVELNVYDITGREITQLVNLKQNSGTYEVDFSGNGLSSGIYFYKMLAEGFSEYKKMVLINNKPSSTEGLLYSTITMRFRKLSELFPLVLSCVIC